MILQRQIYECLALDGHFKSALGHMETATIHDVEAITEMCSLFQTGEDERRSSTDKNALRNNYIVPSIINHTFFK